MRCASCGTELLPGKQFCHVCGTRAVQACPNCGVTVSPGMRFCADCGFQLIPDAPATAPPANAAALTAGNGDRLERLSRHIPNELAQKILASKGSIAGERKLVTVLFCDLVGSTAIAERLDPEEYHELLERYLELAFAEIYRFDGIVNQLAGDGMMALFGAPVAHEDAPHRAIRAALAIRDALTRFNEQGQMAARLAGRALRARVGIHTGPVVVGTVGNDFKMDYSAIGDTTNLAARLQALAQPGTVLISEATQRLVRGFFEVQSAGTFEVKGKSQPVAVYEVQRLSGVTSPMAIAQARGMTPFVGRGEELAQLIACYERLSGSLAQVVAVVGEAGSGKSRLVYEFKQQLGGEDVVFFESRCSSLTQTQPHSPWVHMLRQYFELTSSESPECACDKISRKLAPLDLPPAVYSNLCHLLSLQGDGGGEESEDEIRRHVFEAVAHFMGGVSKTAPVVIVIEDLHWIDDASREMLELAVTQIRSVRVMLLVSHRPDFQPSWRPQAAFTLLNLRPLTDSTTAEIIRAVAGGALPAELEHAIQLRAEGNPFFAEELTRALVEEGYIVRTNGHVRLTRPAEQIRIPGSVEEVLGARVDRLGPHAKRVLQVAAVLGRQFHREQVEQLLRDEEIDIASQLEELERRGVIHRKSVHSADEYRFGESLTQEVAYEGLLLRERRQLHDRIGRMLEGELGGSPSEHAALLAHHFSRSDSHEKAVDALIRAGRHAEQVPSYRSAVELYRRAWDLANAALVETTEPATQTRLRRAAINAAVAFCRMTVIYSGTETADSEQVALHAQELAESTGDPQDIASLYTYHGMIILGGARERFGEGLALVERGAEVAARAGLTAATMNITRAMAWGYMVDGQFARSLQSFEQLLAGLEQAGEAAKLSDIYLGSLSMRTAIHLYGDDIEASHTAATQTYELAVRASNRTIQSMNAGHLALVHLARAEYADAKRWADRSLEIAEAIGNLAAVRTGAIATLAARIELGESVTVSRYLDQIEQRFTALGDLALKIHVAVDAYLAVGEVKRARRLAEQAFAHAGGRLREAISATALGDVMRRLGPEHWDEAQQWYDRALTTARAIGSRSTRALATLGAAELAAARGDHALAVAHADTARTLLRDLGAARYEARAERLLATLHAGATATA